MPLEDVPARVDAVIAYRFLDPVPISIDDEFAATDLSEVVGKIGYGRVRFLDCVTGGTPLTLFAPHLPRPERNHRKNRSDYESR